MCNFFIRYSTEKDSYILICDIDIKYHILKYNKKTRSTKNYREEQQMDIYQIFTAYNNPWSHREILFFSGILIFAVIVVSYYIRKEKLNKLQAMAILAEVIFMGIVFGSTVFTRTGTTRQYELVPVWSWRDILRYHDRQLLKENLLNCILLLPAGALLPLMMNREVKWQEALAFGVLVSATIETSQLITMRGLFEWDDMIHNGLGCMVGAVLVNWVISFISTRK